MHRIITDLKRKACPFHHPFNYPICNAFCATRASTTCWLRPPQFWQHTGATLRAAALRWHKFLPIWSTNAQLSHTRDLSMDTDQFTVAMSCQAKAWRHTFPHSGVPPHSASLLLSPFDSGAKHGQPVTEPSGGQNSCVSALERRDKAALKRLYFFQGNFAAFIWMWGLAFGSSVLILVISDIRIFDLWVEIYWRATYLTT